MKRDPSRDFERGAWFAFDVVLGWINTQNEQSINKSDLYHAVMKMRPESLARYRAYENVPT